MVFPCPNESSDFRKSPKSTNSLFRLVDMIITKAPLILKVLVLSCIPEGWYFSWCFGLSSQQITFLSLMTMQGSSMFDGEYFFNEYAWGSCTRDKQDVLLS